MNLVVVGQGYVGLPLAVAASKGGYFVYGFDIDKSKIQDLKNGVTNSPEVNQAELIELQISGRLQFVDTIPKITKPAIYVIAVPTPLDINRNPDLSMLKSACELISTVVVDQSLIINESTSYIGTLDELIVPMIENSSGFKNLDFAVAPERIDPGNQNWSMKTTPRVLAGNSKSATARALEFYSLFCDQVHVVSKPRVAEAAKLMENTFRQVNIALVNEFAQIANTLDFSAIEAIRAASTKPYGYMPFYPGVGVGGHCIPVDPTYLEFSAEKSGMKTNLVSVANKINFSTPRNIASMIRTMLGGDISMKSIQLAGISYKPNIADTRESPAQELYNQLSLMGAKVLWHDPIVNEWNGVLSQPLQTNLDLGIIVTPHDQINFAPWVSSNVKVIDISSTQKDYGWPKFL